MTVRDLYFGKLLAASLEWKLGLTLALLVSLKVIVLVAVTMIISMHTTTIRAANLLSIVSLGIFSFFGTGLIAMRVGFAVMGQTALGNGSLIFLPYLLTHTLLILPAMLFSGALGLRIGMALLDRHQACTLGQHMLWSLANFLKAVALVIVPVFAVAALIEAVLRVLLTQYVS